MVFTKFSCLLALLFCARSLFAQGSNPSGSQPANSHVCNPAASPCCRPGHSALVECKEIEGGVQWTIKQPNVQKHLTEYPYIEFRPNDVVTVQAFGSVNTGGQQVHLKDYVNPRDERLERKADRLFHGLIWIPGARVLDGENRLATPVATSLVRIQSLASPSRAVNSGNTISSSSNAEFHPERLATEFFIDEPLPGVGAHLRLGYEAENYSLNNYEGCDTSSNKPCATVIITVRSGGASPRSITPMLQFDLLARQLDPNGFMLAPRWQGNFLGPTRKMEALQECKNFPYSNPFIPRGIARDCTRQASFDVPSFWTTCLLEPSLGTLHGHVNWVPATYIGKLKFSDFSPDKDIDLQLSELSREEQIRRFGPTNKNELQGANFGFKDDFDIESILTKDSQGKGSEYLHQLQLEFARYEVTNFFDSANGTQKEWELFHRDDPHCQTAACKEQNKKNLTALLQNKTAVVTGLLDLDCVHECHTELHPLYALAVRTNCEYSDGVQAGQGEQCNPKKGGVANDTWMIFVRNFGNEGSCATDLHYLDRYSYAFYLPAPPDAKVSTPQVTPDTQFYSNAEGLQWTIAPPPQNKRGVLIKFFLAAAKCSLSTPALVRVHGMLHLDWRGGSSPAENGTNSTAVPSSPNVCGDKDYDTCPVTLARQDPEIHPCDDTDEKAQKEREVLEKSKGGFDWTEIPELLRSYFDPDLALSFERLSFGGTKLYGGRAVIELFQTPLGSIEAETAVVRSKASSVSIAPANILHAEDWNLGLRVQVARPWSPYITVKFGSMYRQSDSPFDHFTGRDAFVYTGGGVELARDRPLSLRISAGMDWLWATGEHPWRFNVGPEFSLKKIWRQIRPMKQAEPEGCDLCQQPKMQSPGTE